MSASHRGKAVNRTRIYELLFLTNGEPLLLGEELIMEVDERQKEATGKNRMARRSERSRETSKARRSARGEKIEHI